VLVTGTSPLPMVGGWGGIRGAKEYGCFQNPQKTLELTLNHFLPPYIYCVELRRYNISLEN